MIEHYNYNVLSTESQGTNAEYLTAAEHGSEYTKTGGRGNKLLDNCQVVLSEQGGKSGPGPGNKTGYNYNPFSTESQGTSAEYQGYNCNLDIVERGTNAGYLTAIISKMQRAKGRGNGEIRTWHLNRIGARLKI